MSQTKLTVGSYFIGTIDAYTCFFLLQGRWVRNLLKWLVSCLVVGLAQISARLSDGTSARDVLSTSNA
jgi:hypothetical protein